MWCPSDDIKVIPTELSAANITSFKPHVKPNTVVSKSFVAFHLMLPW